MQSELPDRSHSQKAGVPAYPEIPEAWEECGQHSRKEIALKKSFQIGNSMIVFLILQTMHISIEKINQT